MALKLRSVKIQNCMTLKDVEVQFPEKGLVLVSGKNSTTTSMDSCGSGKTALGEILCRVLFGVRGRYSKMGDFSTKNKGKMLIDIKCDLDGQPLNVIAGYKHKDFDGAGEGLKIIYGNQPIERGHLAGTKEELQSLIKISPDLAAWSIFIDGDKLNFPELSERKGAELLLSALSQVSWDKYNAEARKIYGQFQTQLVTQESAKSTAQQDLSIAEQRISSVKQEIKTAQVNYQQAIAQKNANIAAITELISGHDAKLKGDQQRLKAIKKEIETIEVSHAARFAELETARTSLESQQTILEAEYRPLYEDWAQKDAAEKPLKDHLDEMKKVPKVCPVCNKPWDKAVGEHRIKEAEEKLIAAQIASTEALKKVNLVNGKRQQNTTQLSAVRKEIKSLNVEQAVQGLSSEAKQIEERFVKADESKQSLIESLQRAQNEVVSDAEFAAKKAVLVEREDHKLKCEETLATARSAVEELSASLGVIQYWTKAFGPTGIPNMLIEEAVMPLNASAQRISDWLTGNLISVAYATTRKLASGADKASLDINVDNRFGSSTIEGSSKGEAGLCNLIVSESIAEVGSIVKRVGFRWYDEILNNKDETVRRSILDYLRGLAERKNILIFIVDHHIETASFVDHILIAEKGADGWTKFTWQ